jgi:hypothetical protein
MARVMPLKNFVLNAVMGITAYFFKGNDAVHVEYWNK